MAMATDRWIAGIGGTGMRDGEIGDRDRRIVYNKSHVQTEAQGRGCVMI